MSHPGQLVLAIAMTLALGSLQAWAQVAPPKPTPPPPANVSPPFRKGAAPQTPIPPSDDTGLSLRIYGALNEGRPLPVPPGSDNGVYAVDVSEVVTPCADGSSVITAMIIGGQLTPLNNRCPVEKGRNPVTETPACDANSWNCAISGSPPAN